MVVEVVRFKDGLSMQRYACRITDNAKVRYCRILNKIPTYFEIDEFGVIPNNALTSFKVANGCKEILDNFRDNQAEVVTTEMVQTESLLGIHEDGDSVIDVIGDPNKMLNIDPGMLRTNAGAMTLEQQHANLYHPLLVDRPNKLFDPGNL
ncbi:hypothetical protein VPHK479_0114 [Vibrio phage K479]